MSGSPRVLTVNAGSSSLKLRLLVGGQVAGTSDLPAGDGGVDLDALSRFVQDTRPDVVGHRVVHGGTGLTAPTRLDDGVLAALHELTDLAPLHQPTSLAGIAAVATVLPDAPAVACFDTAFHATLPDAASTYALPLEWRERWHLRRFGFHGLSHAYGSRRAAELVGRPVEGLRVVVCHLGAGASLCAVRSGRSVDTTMGFTPLEGLVMATRSGSVDPGLVLWLQQRAGLSADEVAWGLEHRSGLLGLGGTGDLKVLGERAARGDARAGLAVAVYLHRLVSEVAAMTAALGGLDVLVFTGGVGEHSALVREAVAERCAYLGVAVDAGLDDGRHDAGGPGDAVEHDPLPDRDVSAPGAVVRTLVVAAREDLEIERGVLAVLGGPAAP